MDKEPVQTVSAEELLPTRRKKKITLLDGKVIEIQNLNYGEFMDVMNAAKDDVFKQTLGIVTRGVSSPKLTWQQARELLAGDIGTIAAEIINLSGFTVGSRRKGE